MLRRLVPLRRMFAVALAGVALGACSSGSEDTTAPAPEASAGVNPLNFSLSTHAVSFSYSQGNFAPATQTVDVSGLVVTTTPYVRIMNITYSPSNVKDWLRITQRPTLVGDPQGLGVRLTFTPRFVPGVDLQGVNATVTVTVPGARNGPQTINVNMGVFGCPIVGNLAYPSNNNLIGNLQPGTTCQSDVLAGTRVFDAYSLTVPASATFTIMMRARPSDPSCGSYPCPGTTVGNLYDPYLFLVDGQTIQVVRADDDCGRGFNSPYYDSRVEFTNPSGLPKLYYVLASQYSTSQFGTYTLDVYDGVFFPGYGSGFCSGYTPSPSFLTPGAPFATDPAIAALQKEIREKEKQYRKNLQ